MTAETKKRKSCDVSGFVTQKIASVGGSAVTHAYAYDALGRLVSESVTNAVTSFSYDSAGNRLGSAGASPATFDYVNNRLVSVATNGAAASAVLYDAAGNVTSLVSRAGVTLSLSWNTLGQLVSVSTNGAFAESYTYDALGRRIGTTSLSTTNHEPETIFHAYNGDQCVADTDASGNLLRAYTWGPGTDNLLAVTVYSADATNTYYAVRDRLGSVYALVNSSGAVVESYAYDAWGAVSVSTPNSSFLTPNFFLFHGGAYSAATGLYLFRARWYAPELGRWLSPDPIGLEGGLNLYEFCRNNPVNGRDPSGLTYATNIRFLADWFVGAGGNDRFYGEIDVETQEMANSPGASALRNAFYDSGYVDQRNFSYGTLQAYWDTIINPNTADWGGTGAQVGGFAGASAINNCDGTVTFTIPNVAGTHSFFLHAVPDRTGTTGPMRNIRQTFVWTEAIP